MPISSISFGSLQPHPASVQSKRLVTPLFGLNRPDSVRFGETADSDSQDPRLKELEAPFKKALRSRMWKSLGWGALELALAPSLIFSGVAMKLSVVMFLAGAAFSILGVYEGYQGLRQLKHSFNAWRASRNVPKYFDRIAANEAFQNVVAARYAEVVGFRYSTNFEQSAIEQVVHETTQPRHIWQIFSKKQ